MHIPLPEEPVSALRVAIDETPDERGNMLAFALCTNFRRIALQFNAN
jgi:hypothetical protein